MVAGEDTERTSTRVTGPVWSIFARYGRENLHYASLGAINTVVGRAVALIPAFVIGLAVDAIFLDQRSFALPLVPPAWIPGTDVGQVWFAIGVLLIATVVGAVASWFEDWGWNVFAQRIQHHLRVDTYTKLQRQDLAYFTGQRTGELMSILNNDVNALETFLEDGLNAIFWIVATFVGIGAILLSLNAPLALVTLLPVPLLALFTLAFTRIIEPRYLAIRGEIGDLNARLQNNLSGIEVIKTEHASAYERERVAEASAEYLRANLDAVKVQITYFPGLTLIAGVGFAVTFLVGGYWVLTGPPLDLTATLSPGEFVTFVIYAQQYLWPIVQFGAVVDDYERAKAAGTRVQTLLRREESIEEPSDADPLSVQAGRVEYEDVRFAYTDDRVISGVSFDVDGGHTVGIVGPTGAGKSTLLQLLPRLYDVDAGAVRIDGQDVREVSLASLRQSIGYVSQDPFLFYGTVGENIRYGRFEASDAAVERAAKRAQAHEFVQNLPRGYETLVGERGVRLSGGQRQRLALARTVLKDPEILVLDEATSHVDTETEALIQESIDKFARDRTTFVIAHRLSTVRRADQILVLDDGEIVERGTHDELLETAGLYANLWRVQVGDIDGLPPAFLERARRRQAEIERADDATEEPAWKDW
ncbi:ABC-type multidrug transport system, ATPase and permease component [Halanaeroarchaeum sp. HSR-CO]|uniref:ABC transporter ATP-binding protein n=1 Tax=Halanaeroarchaeum sp. HSR-CO TaxID=2866382 RepID=UPI00217DD5E3|nr:ABC transporter ATP-binding protein [Halanaeroarchaeum sp. HSR-CO]UWG46486.1 ABC-type multidrug transport system, ATPase and permease component [Halanaeroarchaeum sp. HSR-CO]